MRQIREYIKDRQSRFTEISFFQKLDECDVAEEGLAFARGLAFFVMAFQDILRVNEACVRNPEMRIIARHHRLEDKGHDIWFLHDLQVIDHSLPDVAELFSPAAATTRDTAYALMGEVYRATDDRTNIALLLVLESTGHVFFNRVVSFVERCGFSRKLRYFDRGHLDIELGHELFEQRMDAVLDAMELSEAQYAEITRAVDNAFAAMTNMLETLAERVQTRGSRPPLSVPPVSTTLSRAPVIRKQHKVVNQ